MKENENNQDVKKYRFLFSVRSYVALMMCLCMATQYAQRLNLTIAIVRMVNHTAIKLNNSESIDNTTEINDGPFIWNKSLQGRLLSSYYFGYILFQIVGGVLACKYGPCLILILSMAAGTITTCLTPIAARTGYAFAYAARFLTGLSAGLVWPSLVELSTRWSADQEKSIMLASAYSGAQIGPILFMPLFGALCALDARGGWPLPYYASGMMGAIWCIACFLTMTSNPKNHWFISESEKTFITNNAILTADRINQKRISVRGIFTSIPCLTMFGCYFLNCLGFYTILSFISTYINDIFGLNVDKNGYITAIPYLFYFITAIASGAVADILIQKNILSTTNCRKTFTGIGNLGAAVTIFSLGFVDKSLLWVAILLLTMTKAFLGLNSGGLFIVPQDMTPKYAAVIWGIANTFGSAAGFIVPLIVGEITTNGFRKQWIIVFTFCAAAHGLCAILFGLFGSAKNIYG